MKRKLIGFKLSVCVSLLFLFSCTEKKLEYFKLNIIYSEPVSQSKEGDPLPKHLISLFNYYEDSTCKEKVYVPVITLVRTDFSPERSQIFDIELSSVNKFRKSCNMLSGVNLIEDYDENISGLKTPKILSEPSLVLDKDQIKSTFTNVIIVSIEDINMDTINSIKKRILYGLCSEKMTDAASILFVRSVNVSITADSALKKFNSWKSEKSRGNTEVDSLLQTLERQFPKDYRFTLERLKLKNVDGVIKESDEYLLLLAVEKAINEGKAADLLAIIGKMNLPSRTKDEAKKSISEKPKLEIKLPADKAVSFRRQNIEVKLSIIADGSNNPRDRKIFKEIILEDFEDATSKVTVETLDSTMTVSIKSIDDYLDKLRFSKNYKIKVISFNRNPSGKIISIRITENFSL